jgi:hypothetical protein
MHGPSGSSTRDAGGTIDEILFDLSAYPSSRSEHNVRCGNEALNRSAETHSRHSDLLAIC